MPEPVDPEDPELVPGPENDIEIEYLEVIGTALAMLQPKETDSLAFAEYKTLARQRLEKRTDFYRPDNICPARHRIEFVEDKHASARTMKALMSPYHPLWMFLVFSLIPPVIVGLIYGGVPLNDPDSRDFDSYMTYIMFLCPVTCCILVSLWNTQFMTTLGIHNTREMWLQYLLPFLATYVASIIPPLCILPFYKPFPTFGLLPIVVTLFVFIFFMFCSRHFYIPCACKFYLQKRITFLYMLLLLSFFFCIFVAYTLVYRQIPGSYQKALTAIWIFLLFFFKKGMLTITETLPYVTSMLLSGFSLQSMSDVFFVMVYPNIQSPKSTFIVIFFIISGTDYLYLLFMTTWWFRFRVWIKGRLKSCFCCRHYDPVMNVPFWEEDVDLDDRGQTNNRPGYLRRQIQFFYYRVASGITAQLFYLIGSPLFRYWNNQDYFPLNGQHNGFGDEIREGNYRDSLIYAGARLGTLLVLIPISTSVIFYLCKEQLFQLAPKYRRLLKTPRYIMAFGTSLIANMLLCAWMALAHNEIWFIDTD